ncbi:hypothetical protein JMJ35_009721 [Cladonia borealis]|uniref:Uncharacterized protein n=1 Tax=Cladonia borealis TaxID=184061 RepID=A0AA39QRH9_9LECA|nr:hypothetical protein JMJ35_009721 [Cladonia borealis]
MNSSARNIFPSLQLRPASFVKTLSILGIFIVVISYSYWSHLANIKGVFTHLKPTPAQTQQPEKLADHGWTQNIWQTSQYPAENISRENEKYMKTWTDLNPGYQQKLLTDDLIAGYVRDHFHASNPDIEETFLQAKDFVSQLDLMKYMVLWAEGGVYSDLDVACVQPLSQWVPPQFIDRAGIVLGMQSEQKTGLDGNARDSFQLADWTMMSKPNQPFLWFLYQSLTENIKHLAAKNIVPASNSRAYNISDVTGRNALTQAFLAYATSVTATKVTVENFTKVAEPTLFGEILVLPVQAFASSYRNGKELVHHYEAGSWKLEPWDKLQPEEQKVKEPEEKGGAGEEKDVEEEKQKQEGMETTGGDQNPEEGKASPADEKEPASDKPPSIQYENAQVNSKPTTNDNPPSIQYQNIKVSKNATNTNPNKSNNTTTNPPTVKNTEILKAQTLENQKHKEAIASQISQAQQKAQEAEKKKEKEEEERIAEEMKKPQWTPLKEKGRLESSNNLADYVIEGGDGMGWD